MRYIDSLLPSSADKRYFPFISSQRAHSVPSSRTTPVSPARDTHSPATRPAPLQLPPQTLPGVPGGRPCSPALEARFTRPGAPVTPFCIRCRDQRSCHSCRVARWPANSDAVGWESSPGFARPTNHRYAVTTDRMTRQSTRSAGTAFVSDSPAPKLRARSRPAGAATLVSSRRFGGWITRIRM